MLHICNCLVSGDRQGMTSGAQQNLFNTPSISQASCVQHNPFLQPIPISTTPHSKFSRTTVCLPVLYIIKPRSHTMKSLKALQSLQEKRSLPYCDNVNEAFQCSVSYTMI